MRIADETSPVGPGDAIAIPPGSVHQITNTGHEELRFLCCCAPGYQHDDTVLVEAKVAVGQRRREAWASELAGRQTGTRHCQGRTIKSGFAGTSRPGRFRDRVLGPFALDAQVSAVAEIFEPPSSAGKSASPRPRGTSSPRPRARSRTPSLACTYKTCRPRAAMASPGRNR